MWASVLCALLGEVTACSWESVSGLSTSRRPRHNTSFVSLSLSYSFRWWLFFFHFNWSSFSFNGWAPTGDLEEETKTFMERWFPKEVRQKVKTDGREVAVEQLEELGLPIMPTRCLISWLCFILSCISSHGPGRYLALIFYICLNKHGRVSHVL